jgi:TRAP-type C4-dicarboxylate transport system permease small subunit
MKMKKVTIVRQLFLVWMPTVGIMVVMISTCTDIVLSLSRVSLVGLPELSSLACAFAGLFAICYCQFEKSHLAITLINRRFSPKVQAINEMVSAFFSLALCFLLAYQYLLWGISQIGSGSKSMGLDIPIYIIVLAAGVPWALLCIIFGFDLKNAFIKVFGPLTEAK